MKISNMVKAFIMVCFVSIKLMAGETYVLRYSPANPVAGQLVSFTLENDDLCQIESVIPDAVNNIGNLVLLDGSYTYAQPGIYHVAFDITVNPQCAIREKAGNKRQLISNFQFGPVGGTTVPAVMQNGIFCSPLVVGAAPAIPTLSQWMIIILALVIVTGGVVYQMNSTLKQNSSV